MELTPEIFLSNKGIELRSTALFTMIDGYVRQPDLIALLNEFAQLKIKELDLKITPESSLLIERITKIKEETKVKEICCPKCKGNNIEMPVGMPGYVCLECGTIW